MEQLKSEYHTEIEGKNATAKNNNLHDHRGH